MTSSLLFAFSALMSANGRYLVHHIERDPSTGWRFEPRVVAWLFCVWKNEDEDAPLFVMRDTTTNKEIIGHD